MKLRMCFLVVQDVEQCKKDSEIIAERFILLKQTRFVRSQQVMYSKKSILRAF